MHWYLISFLMGLFHYQQIFAEGIEYDQYIDNVNNQAFKKVAYVPKERVKLLLREKRAADKGTKLPTNNSVVTSNHTYYTASFLDNVGNQSKYFMDLKIMKERNNSEVKLTTFRASNPGITRFFIQKLKFVFPFYGHDISQVVVTSAGFLHVGQIIHNFAHDVHYIAPLMANFTPTGNETSNVYTYDDGFRFIAQWDSVYEADRNSSTEPFTFQVSLFKDGTIFFSYRDIPYNVSEFASKRLQPKVGLADGYIYKFYIRVLNVRFGPYHLITRYHTVSLKKNVVGSNSAFILTPIPNCISAKSCGACFSKEIAANFKCKWCSKLQLCSDSLDWHRQKWVLNGCPLTGISNRQQCNATLRTTPSATPITGTRYAKRKSKAKEGHPNYAAIFITLTVVIVLISLIAVCAYGYRNPSSKVGMFMIEHRPAKLFGRI